MKPTPELRGKVHSLNRALVSRDQFGGRVALYLVGVTPPGFARAADIDPDESAPDFFAISGEVEKREPNQEPRPVAYLDDVTAQGLADSLYAAGFRPTEAAGSVGQLAATEAHLATVKGILDQTLPVVIRRAEG